MIHTKEQIVKKAIQVMKEINWNYDVNKLIIPLFDSKKDRIEEDKKYVKDPKLLELGIKNAKPDYWVIGFDFEPEAEIEYNSMFLRIWDETAEPFEISHKQAKLKVLKNEEGRYYLEKNK